ncbi:UNKNOWN [Stylonychia lemnae]|uniref:Uncharacterized protein n=1 Tax=Stylonychia lemnae TaxID=5949 RepID=A0A078ALP9_STYLE|nr:UNKNOWN [Stylonychia lemnae]|eukprot:CDW83275.1 UNKNOWN [Stylonychia lemnae]
MKEIYQMTIKEGSMSPFKSNIATPLGKTIEKDHENRQHTITQGDEYEQNGTLKQNLFNNRLMMDFAFNSEQKNNSHLDSVLMANNSNLNTFNIEQYASGVVPGSTKPNRDLLDFYQANQSQRTDQLLQRNSSSKNMYGTGTSNLTEKMNESKQYTYNYQPNQVSNFQYQHHSLKPLYRDLNSTTQLGENLSQDTLPGLSPFKQNFSAGNIMFKEETYDKNNKQQHGQLDNRDLEKENYLSQTMQNITQTDNGDSFTQDFYPAKQTSKQSKENKAPKQTSNRQKQLKPEKSQKSNINDQNYISNRSSRPPAKNQSSIKDKKTLNKKSSFVSKDQQSSRQEKVSEQKCCNDREQKEQKFNQKNSQQRKHSRYQAINQTQKGSNTSFNKNYQDKKDTHRNSIQKRGDKDHQSQSKSKSRQRSRSFDFSRSLDNKQNNAFKNATKVLNQNFKSNSSVTKLKYSASREKKSQERDEFIRKIYQNNNRNASLNDKQKQHLRQLSSEKECRPRSITNQSNSHSQSKIRRADSAKRSARDGNRMSRGASFDTKNQNHGQNNGTRNKQNNSMIMAISQSKSKKQNEDLETHDHQMMIGGVLGNIEKLLQLLKDHCKVCPQFALEFEKLNI